MQLIYLEQQSILILLSFREIMYVSAFNEKSSEMFLIELPKPKSIEIL